jgi:Flp pilus assembly protein TadD
MPRLPTHSRFVLAQAPVSKRRSITGWPTRARAAASPEQKQNLSRRHALALARQALRRGDIDEAERTIARAAVTGGDDPAFHNVAGVLYECRGDVRKARTSYGKAIALSPAYAPAQQNMRRLYELDTFGRTSKSVHLGDEARA